MPTDRHLVGREAERARFRELLDDPAGKAVLIVGRREEALSAIEESVEIRRDLAAARPEAFGPDLALSLNTLSVCLGDLGRREDALAVSEEATRMLAPHFFRLPRAFESRMRTLLGVYEDRCDETDSAPDEGLVSPIREALARLDQEGDSGV